MPRHRVNVATWVDRRRSAYPQSRLGTVAIAIVLMALTLGGCVVGPAYPEPGPVYAYPGYCYRCGPYYGPYYRRYYYWHQFP